ncbi:MAG: VWA domain-containing protein [Candidatus Korobacteraceae bacterium]|jgi:VWFA-related protein
MPLKSTLLLWVITSMTAFSGAAQQATDQSQRPQSSQPPAQQDSAGTYKVNVNVVNLYFVAKDKHGVLVPNLAQDQFEILEDGQPQAIKYYQADAKQPLTLGLLVDTSGSEARMLPTEQEVAGQFIGTVLREKDLAFLISFDVNVDLLQDITATGQDLRAALRKTRINTGGGGGLPGLGGGPVPQAHPKGTLLYDAIYLASREKLRHEVGRKAMIIFTDGEDEGSQTSLGEAIEAAQQADTIVYVVLVYDPRFIRGDQEMRRLCQETGGRVIVVGTKPDKLKKALEEVSEELRSQYYIGYTPTNRNADGGFRKVEIHTKTQDYHVQARKGYYAPKQ